MNSDYLSVKLDLVLFLYFWNAAGPLQ